MAAEGWRRKWKRQRARNASRTGWASASRLSGKRLKRVLTALESQGFNPRIQDAWRSKADQLAAYNAGTSHLKFGYHSVTGAGGKKEALAADVLDDTRPLGPTTRYKLALALAARAQGLETGILFDLRPALVAGVEAALAAKNLNANVKTGWDPTHVQVTSPAVAAARMGGPTLSSPPNPPPVPRSFTPCSRATA